MRCRSSAGGLRRQFVSYGGINAQGKYIYIVADAAEGVRALLERLPRHLAPRDSRRDA